jgi:hypothetical protein
MYFETTAWLIAIPSLSSSPWIRGASHKGFSRLMRLIRFGTSTAIGGRPRRRDFQARNARKPFRCHRITVAGSTIAKALAGLSSYAQQRQVASAALSSDANRLQDVIERLYPRKKNRGAAPDQDVTTPSAPSAAAVSPSRYCAV